MKRSIVNLHVILQRVGLACSRCRGCSRATLTPVARGPRGLADHPRVAAAGGEEDVLFNEVKFKSERQTTHRTSIRNIAHMNKGLVQTQRVTKASLARPSAEKGSLETFAVRGRVAEE